MVFHCRCFSFSTREEWDSQATNNNLRVFTFSELKAATKNFSLSAKIGEGGFGCVYKGVVKIPQDSTKTLDVAVKRFGETRLRVPTEWVKEVNVAGVVQHPNLVKLLGYCVFNDERLLVYEYMPNKSIRYHLSTRSEATLSWIMRLKVAHDVARGLTYLHEEMDFQIIFRDLKPSNVLLDDQWNTKLSDIGLAQLGPEDVGAVGYMAPEYIETGHLTCKIDVWSYGVFLYELITGKLPSDTTQPENEQKLLERLELIIDPRLEAGNYSLESAHMLSIIANKCLSIDPESRPKMSEALHMVNRLITGVPPPLKSLVSVVAIEPEMVFTHAKDYSEKMKNEGKKECSEVQHKCVCCVS